MNIRTKITLVVLPLCAALVWTAGAQSDLGSSETDAETLAAEVEAARMEIRQEEIVERVGMSAPLEMPDPGQSDVVAEALRDGRLIEVTLEEVEAALNAAKATPGTEDDVEAMNLAHWGSYRFFLDGEPSADGAGSTH